MKLLKICILLLLTLAAMRATGWAVAWAMVRVGAKNLRIVAALANLVGFAAFVLLLNFNLLPGEPVDWPAISFGLVVFVLCAVSDLFWRPWAGRVRPSADV